MDHEKWARIEELLQRALDLEPSMRPAWLAEACAGDEVVRREVEALLSYETAARGFIESPVVTDLAVPLPAPGALVGRRLGRYHIVAFIGAGGMGEVYLAQDDHLPRTVALKMLAPDVTVDADAVRRLAQEARAASTLNHPNIITVFEIVEADGTHFIVTEYVEGRSLRDLLIDAATNEPKALPLEHALDIAIQIARALVAAHTAWIIHRDIKPENVMVRADGLVKVLDFGIAKLGDGADRIQTGQEPPSRDAAPAPHLTNPGTILGTVRYMSPEQARGERLDGRADVFSLGAVLYEMVTGRVFRPEGGFPDVPRAVEPLIRKALEPDRDARHASAAGMLRELEDAQHRLESRSGRRLAKVGVVALALAALAVAVAGWASITETWHEGVLRDGHTAAVRQTAFSPDGRLLITVGEDRQVIAWDFDRRERIKTLAGHEGAVTSVAFSPDGRLFATAGAGPAVIVWDAARLEQVRRLTGRSATVGALGFSPDGRILAASFTGDPVYETVLWNTARWDTQRVVPHGIQYGPILFSPDSSELVFSIGQWNIATGRMVAQEKDGWNWAAFTVGARRMATATSGGEIAVLELPRPGELIGSRLVARRRGHQDHGRAVAFSPDGALIASGAENILLWETATMARLGRFEHEAIVWSLQFSPDGRWLVSSHGDGSIVIWDLAERRREASLNGHVDAVHAVAVSPDGRLVASAGDDRSVIVWNAVTGLKEAVLTGHDTRVIGAGFSPDGTWLVSSDQDGSLIRWDLGTRRSQWKVSTTSGDNVCLSVSADGAWLATRPGVFESGGGRTVASMSEAVPGHRPEGLAFSPDGGRLASAGSDQLALLDTHTWRPLGAQAVAGALSLAFAPDGRSLVTGSVDGTIVLWDAVTLRRLGTLGTHAARIKSVAFSPDGARVATTGDDGMIALWSVRRRALISRIASHGAPVYAIAFSPDGRWLISGGHDRSVRRYSLRRTLWGIRLD